MQIITRTLEFQTTGYSQIVHLTGEIQKLLDDTYLKEGSALISAIGSTTGITTLEFEPGLVKNDVAEMFEQFAPYAKNYKHNQTWGDDNGAAHLRSMITGTSLTIPFINKELILGTWQQIVFLDFDTRPRERKVIVQFIGV
jgi:secondary thiamine-phosphate synthase enzyme